MDELKKKGVAAQIAIREAGGADLEPLVELWHGQHDYHVDLDNHYYEPTSEENIEDAREYFKKAVEGSGPKILLAESGGEVIGFITFKRISKDLGIARSGTKIKEYGEVEDLFVTSNCRGQGIGKQLMDQVEKYFKEQGIVHMMVEVSAFNEATIDFYRKDGFRTQQVGMFKEI